MKYLCLLYGNQQKVSQLPKQEFADLVERCKEYDAELHRTGAVQMVESLEWDVTTVRPKDGKPTVIDGPFVETRDVVGSIMIIDARDVCRGHRAVAAGRRPKLAQGVARHGRAAAWHRHSAPQAPHQQKEFRATRSRVVPNDADPERFAQKPAAGDQLEFAFKGDNDQTSTSSRRSLWGWLLGHVFRADVETPSLLPTLACQRG